MKESSNGWSRLPRSANDFGPRAYVLLTAHLRAGWRRETGAPPHEGRPFVWHVTQVSGLPSFSEGHHHSQPFNCIVSGTLPLSNQPLRLSPTEWNPVSCILNLLLHPWCFSTWDLYNFPQIVRTQPLLSHICSSLLPEREIQAVHPTPGTSLLNLWGLLLLQDKGSTPQHNFGGLLWSSPAFFDSSKHEYISSSNQILGRCLSVHPTGP